VWAVHEKEYQPISPSEISIAQKEETTKRGGRKKKKIEEPREEGTLCRQQSFPIE
jgi:hypothetical protein